MSGLNLAHVDALLTALRAIQGVKSADLDPGKVNRLPGVWVRIARVEVDTYGGDHTIGLQLHLAVAEKDMVRAWPDLRDLYNAVTEVVTPTGPTQPITLTLPDRPGLPALLVPVDLVP